MYHIPRYLPVIKYIDPLHSLQPYATPKSYKKNTRQRRVFTPLNYLKFIIHKKCATVITIPAMTKTEIGQTHSTSRILMAQTFKKGCGSFSYNQYVPYLTKYFPSGRRLPIFHICNALHIQHTCHLY